MEGFKKSVLVKGNSIIGAVGDKIYTSTPVGVVQAFSGNTVPNGYLLCDGSLYKVADYPELYNVIGNTYGGDGENFNVPNLVDKFIQGSTASGIEKEAGLPNITGQIGNESDSHAIFYNSTVSGAFKANKNAKLAGGGSSTGEWYAKALFDASLSNPIYGNSDTVQPPALTMVYIIKAFHTNEGVDGGVSDDVIDYVDGKINDTTTDTKTTWSSNKINKELEDVRSDIQKNTADIEELQENTYKKTEAINHNDISNKNLPDQHPIHSITGLENTLMQLLDNASGVRNLLDDAEWSTGFYNNSNVASVFKSYCNAIIPVVPGETLYMNFKPKSLNMALFDLSKNFIQNLNVTSDTINIPDNANIAYISIPITASSLQGAIVSREKISQKGSLTKAIYSATPGEPETITLNTIRDAYIYPNSYLVFTTNDNYTTGVTPEWKATYALQKDGVIGNYVGLIILGYKPETAEFLCVSLAGHMYVFSNKIAGDFKQYADSEFKMIDKLRTMVGQIASANESVSTKTIPLEPVRKITTNSAFIFTKQDGSILQTITFERLNELLNSDYTVEDFTPATGLVYMNNAAAYPSGAIFNLSSLTPVTSYSTVDIAYKPENQWQGLLWYAYGTSLTAEGTGKYAKPLAEMAGLTLKNYGKGGSGIIPALHGDDSIKTRCMRLTDGKANADLITVEIIPNDGSGTLGTSTDTSDDTFCGNLNQILEYLQTNCPKSQIVVLIANRGRYKAYDESTQYPPTSENVTKRLEWEAMTEEVCKRNCVPCINANDSGLGYYRVTGNNNYIADQIHMTDLGGYNIAKCFWLKLKNIPTLTTAESGE